MLELKAGTTMSGYIYFIITIYLLLLFFNLVYVYMGEGATLCCVVSGDNLQE